MRLLISSWTYDNPLSFDNFFNMPPGLYMKNCCYSLVPDYPVLLLFDEFVGSEETFHLIREVPVYREVADLWDALLAEGRLTLRNLGSAVEPYKNTIEASVRYDLRNVDAWFPAFRESVIAWRHFLATVAQTLRRKKRESGLDRSEEGLMLMVRRKANRDFMVPKDTEWNVDEVFGSWRKRIEKHVRDDALYIMEQYFRYIATNVMLCRILGTSLHDWADVAPLYEMKLRVGLQRDLGSHDANQVRQLFRVMFPEFRPKSVRSFIKALADPRVQDLRRLVNEAASGRVTFDEAFASQTFNRLFKGERRLAVQREVIGWISLPFDFIPVAGTAIQKGIEEGIGQLLEKKAQNQFSWFYLISKISKTE